jgi:hypothetical protein
MQRRNLLSGLSAAGLLVAVASEANAKDASPGQTLVDQFASTLSAHDIQAFGELFADDYVNHQVSAAAPPPPTTLTPKQASVAFFLGRIKGMPDLKVTVEASVVGPDMVAASFVYEGTQTATYLGVPPTGRRLRFSSCDIFRNSSGKLAEHWGMGDIAGINAQLKG